jgi:hypothetical protein
MASRTHREMLNWRSVVQFTTDTLAFLRAIGLYSA